jgi:hypothetical protein
MVFVPTSMAASVFAMLRMVPSPAVRGLKEV